jgi:hypothetical protein
LLVEDCGATGFSIASVVQRGAERGDLLVLGCEARQRCDLENGEVSDLLLSVGKSLLEVGVGVLEPDDLGSARVG